MDKTARSLIKLLHSQEPNLRLASMRVVAALEMSNKAVIDALSASLDSDVEALQVQALRTLAILGPKDAINEVAPKLLESGSVRQQAAQVLVLGGTASVPALRKLYTRADYHGKRAIASTLAEIGGRPVFQFLIRALPNEDLEMIKHLTECMRAVFGRMPRAARLTAARDLRAFLKLKSTQKNPYAVISALILLGDVRDPKGVDEAQKILLGYLDRRQPEAIRRNAAISLSKLPVERKQADAWVPRLLPYLTEPNWSPVVQNLLPLLQRLEVSKTAATKLLPLLQKSPHVAVQVHVLSRLQEIDRAPVVRAVLPLISSQNPSLSDAAQAALKSMPSAIDSLFALLVSEKDPEITRRMQWILRAYPETARKRYASRAADKLLQLHDKADPQASVFLDFVCATDPAVLQKRVTTRVATLKKSSARNRWERIASLLKLLGDRNLQTPAQRYEYALVLLRKSKRDVRREARNADPSLHVMSGLARQEGAKLVRNLQRERGLGAEDYYYLGFHWSEGNEEMREHGRALLAHLVKSYPRHKLRRAAQHKIELQERAAARVEE